MAATKLEAGRPEEVRTEPSVASIYLSTQYVRTIESFLYPGPEVRGEKQKNSWWLC
jgi:hypothetical protein